MFIVLIVLVFYFRNAPAFFHRLNAPSSWSLAPLFPKQGLFSTKITTSFEYAFYPPPLTIFKFTLLFFTVFWCITAPLRHTSVRLTFANGRVTTRKQPGQLSQTGGLRVTSGRFIVRKRLYSHIKSALYPLLWALQPSKNSYINAPYIKKKDESLLVSLKNRTFAPTKTISRSGAVGSSPGS